MRQGIAVLILVCLATTPAGAVNYYVSPTGSDAVDGLTESTAWASINNGDALGLLSPGDTVFVLPGTYLPSDTVVFYQSGTDGNPIVYLGDQFPVFDMSGADRPIFHIHSDHATFSGFHLTNSVHDGFELVGTNNVISRNIVSHVGKSGIYLLASAATTCIDNNTIHGAGINGIYRLASAQAGHIRNNIIDSSGTGIRAQSSTLAAFNNIWQCGQEYFGGVSDSSGGISVDPQFIGPESGNFTLGAGSPCIDVGMDVGESYSGAAPDLGAIETPSSVVHSGNWVATGYYTGDGSGSQQITGLGFSPSLVLIKGNQDAPTAARSSTMSGDMSKSLGSGSAVSSGLITSLDGDGFTVGNASGINDPNIAYYWVALRARPGLMHVGSYVGNDTDDRNITGLGFTPTYVMVMGETNEKSFQRFADQAPDRSIEFDNSSSDGNRIQDFIPDGFQIGKDQAVNQTLATYHYVALADRDEVLESGSYTGNLQDDRTLDILGFEPGYLAIKQDGGESPAQRPASILGDASLTFHRDPLFADAIQAFRPAGFEIGTSKTVNDNNRTYYYLALTDVLNQRPILGYIGPQIIDEGDALNVLVSAVDPDGTTPVLNAEDVPANASFIDNGDGSGLFSFTPDYDQAGAYSVRFIATDGGLADTELVTITVNNFNTPPVWTTIGDQTVAEGGQLQLWLIAIDDDDDPLMLTALDVPENATFVDSSNSRGSFEFAPSYTQVGSYTVTFIASDGPVADTEIVVITVTDVNAPPVITPIDTQYVDEGKQLNRVVSTTDPDGTKPSLYGEHLPLHATFADHGNGTGKLEFDPDYTQAGVYEVWIIASDGELADTEFVTIVVNNVKAAPILDLIPDHVVMEGENLTFDISATSPDGSTLTLSVTGNPANSNLSDHGDGTGTFDFDPDFTQAGAYLVNFFASDGLEADTESSTITVLDSNRAPVWNLIDDYAVEEGMNVSFDVFASDPDGTIPELSVDELPTGATFIDHADGSGSFGFTPGYDQAGLYTLHFIASDGSADDTQFVDLTVTNVNRAPVLAPLSDRIVGQGQDLMVTVRALDPDSTVPTLSASGVPTSATFTDLGDGTGAFAFTPGETQLGDYEIEFVASDGDLADTAFVTITVVATNLPPQWTPVSDQTVTEGQQLSYDVSATDPEGSTPVLSAKDVPENATWVDHFDGTATLTFNPTYTQSGSYQVTLIASDGSLADTVAITVTVEEAGNQPPFLEVSGSTVTSVGGALHLDLTATDPDDPVVDLSVVGAPVGAAFVDHGSNAGEFDFATGPGDVGTYPLLFIAADATLADTVSLTLQVTEGSVVRIEISPDSVFITTDDTQTFSVQGFDGLGFDADPGVITWSVTEPLGSVDAEGMFDPTGSGVTRIVARSEFGPVDTTDYVEVSPGALYLLEITPNTALLTKSDNLTFSVIGFDSESNITDVGSITWSVLGAIGSITEAGVFTATTSGAGRIVATSSIGAIADTTGTITVAGDDDLAYIFVTPDTASFLVGDQRSFIVKGFTPTYQLVDPGAVNWSIDGDIGGIDTDGRFTATQKGVGRIVATSLTSGLTDSSGVVVVDVLYADDIPLGNRIVHADDLRIPALGLRIENRFDAPKGVTSLTVRDRSTGTGTANDVRSNISFVSLHLDANGNGLLDAGDTELEATNYGAETTFDFAPITILPHSSKSLFVAYSIGAQQHDGDSLDMEIVPAVDIGTTDASPVGGDETLNSLGRAITDGLVRGQVSLSPSGISTLGASDGLSPVLRVGVPRNGYAGDELQVLTLKNYGSAQPKDFDSLVCYLDDGNGVWDGSAIESHLGSMKYTGGLWSISGISVPMTGATTVVHVAARVSSTATDGATLALGLPLHAIEMASDNDGPIDGEIAAVESIELESTEALTIENWEVSNARIVPGVQSPPVLAFQLTNPLSMSVTLQSVDFEMLLSDAGGATAEELRSQIDSVRLWIDRDGLSTSVSASDSVLGSGELDGDRVTIPVNGLTLPGVGGISRFFVTVFVDPLRGKNANAVDVRIASAADVRFATQQIILGSFPVASQSLHTIDGFSSPSVIVHEPTESTVFGGTTQFPVLDVSIPRNGYRNDALQFMRIDDHGTVNASTAITRLQLWHDDTQNGLTIDDHLLGTFVNAGESWTLQGISHPLPDSLNRLIITADVADNQNEGGTLQLGIPVGGLVYASGTTGPDDGPIGDENTYLVLPTDRITVISIPSPPVTVAPGSEQNRILTFALYNGYDDVAHTLGGATLTNISRVLAGAAFADDRIGQLALYHDADDNRELDDDPLIATGYFLDGTARFSGLNVVLPATDLTYFFVTADIPLDPSDGDTLAVSIENLSDLEFEQVVNLNGDIPLRDAAVLVVDGSVEAQYATLSNGGAILRSGESNVPVFAFQPAINGGIPDVLQEVHLTNLGDADTTELTALRIWMDSDGDQSWSASDIYVGDCLPTGDGWTCSNMNVGISGSAPTLFVTADIDDSALAEQSVRFSIPIGGCQFASANDGPRDEALTAGQTQFISRSQLAATGLALNGAYSVGQVIPVGVRLTNFSAEPLSDYIIRVLDVSAPSLVHLDSVSGAGTEIPPGGSIDVYQYYTAVNPGTIHWAMRGVAESLNDSSVVVQTPEISLQSAPSPMLLDVVNSIPPAVNRGQENIVPFTLIVEHSDPDSGTAPVLLQRVELTAVNSDGQPIEFNTIASGLVLSSDRRGVAILEDIPEGSTATLELSEASLIQPGETQRYTVFLDVRSDAANTSFRLQLADPAALSMVDANTGVLVPLHSSVSFPLQTGVCRIADPAQHLAVSARSALGATVNLGQTDVGVFTINLRHSGEESSSQIQLTRLQVGFESAAGVSLPPNDLFQSVRLTRNGFVLGQVSGFAVDQMGLTIVLGAPVTLNPGETITVDLRATIRPTVGSEGFRCVVQDSTAFTVRDVSSGAVLPVVGDQLAAGDENQFPLRSDYAVFRRPAEPLDICLTSDLSAAVIGGAHAVSLFTVTADYPVNSDRSAANMQRLSFLVFDTLGRVLDPTVLFDRVGYRVDGGSITYLSAITLEQGRVVVPLDDDGIVFEPRSSASITVVCDLESDAPYDHFVARLEDASDLDVYDATDATLQSGVTLSGLCATTWPFIAGPASVIQPAGRPALSVSVMPAQIVYIGQSDVELLHGTLDYQSQVAQGDLTLNELTLRLSRRTTSSTTVIDLADVFESVRLDVAGSTVSTTVESYQNGLVTLTLDPAVTVPHGDITEFTVIGDVRASAMPGNVAASLPDTTAIDLSDAQLGTAVHVMAAGQSFPISGPELSISAGDLESSFSNYPNPFVPSADEVTRIGYVLPQDGNVSILIYSITGQEVRQLVREEPRVSGGHDTDVWDGRNGDSKLVVPGTYFCVLRVEYTSGEVVTHRRKIAVVR